MGLINGFQNLIYWLSNYATNKEIRAWETLWVRVVMFSNMHYSRCTPDDIVFLRFQISGEKMVSPMLLPKCPYYMWSLFIKRLDQYSWM